MAKLKQRKRANGIALKKAKAKLVIRKKRKKRLSAKAKKISLLIKDKIEANGDRTLAVAENYFIKEMTKQTKLNFEGNYSKKELKTKEVQQEIEDDLKSELENIKTRFQTLELKPAMRTITVEEITAFSEVEENFKYFLSFPYIQFYRIGDSLFVTCSKTPVKSLKDTLHYLPLPNAGDMRSAVCLGRGNLKDDIKDYVKRYFNSVFNGSHHEYVEFPNEVRNFRKWEKSSANNPNFWKEVSWKKGCSLEDFIDRFINGDYYDSYDSY
jgi:hypothetical protein